MHRVDATFLAGLPVFRGLGDTELREIVGAASRHLYATDEVIYHEGQDADRFYLLLDGHIRVVRTTREGKQIIALHIPPGQLFGIASALERRTYPAAAVAANDVFALAWPTDQWGSFARRYPSFAQATREMIGARLNEMNDRLMELATQHVQSRVAWALLRLVDQSGPGDQDGVDIAFPVTRQQISEMSGSTLHTVSRLLSAWEKQGILESRRRHINVRDTGKLRRLAE